MSFYGNVTNTSRTHFQFDRIYSSRKEMDQNKEKDGIYAGRFVLVEYDSEMHMDSYLRISRIEQKDNSYLYYSVLGGSLTSQETLLTRSNIHKDTIVYISEFATQPTNGYYIKNCSFFRCTSDFDATSTEPATFVKITDETEETYIQNYSIDQKTYGRGYDSTVWQKVYAGGQEYYMMIAELNTVVPMFDLQADAPTQAPVPPHFDTESSDLYYKLHYQPSWGMRIKGSRAESGPEFTHKGEQTEISTFYSVDSPAIPYKSDQTTVWERSEYDPDTGRITTYYWHSNENITTTYVLVGKVEQWRFQYDTYYTWDLELGEYERATVWDANTEYYQLSQINTGIWRTWPPSSFNETPAAIYYNRAGFSPETISIDESIDHIDMTPTGKSGHQYNEHGWNPTAMSAQPDIQELSIMLPSIGTSIAKMWNLIYGNEKQNNGLERNLDIQWDSTEGLRLVKEDLEGNGFTYTPEQMSTLAGSINAVHDLMGMIIENPNVAMTNFANSADNDHIYYSDGQYYRKHLTYEYEDAELEVSYTELGRISKEEYDLNIYYIPDGRGGYKEATSYNSNQSYWKRKRTVTDEMTYRQINWEKFDEFPADKYYYGGPYIYNLEVKDYPTYSYNYLTTEDPNESFFSEVALSEYHQYDYYKFDYVEIPYGEKDKNGNQPKFTGWGYINGDTQNIIGTEYCKINVTVLETNKLNRPYAPNTYYVYKNKDDGSIGGSIDPTISGSQLLQSLQLADELEQQANYSYYMIEIDPLNDEVSIERQNLYMPTKDHFYFIPSNGKQQKYINCINNNGVITLTSDVIYNTNVQFCVIAEVEGTRTKHFYRPNIYFNAEEDENGKKIKYVLCADDSLNQKLIYYAITDNQKEIILDPKIYYYGYPDGTPYTDKKYFTSYQYYYQLENNQYVLDRANKPTENRIYFLKENFLYVKEDRYDYFGVGAEWNPQITDVPEGLTLAIRKEVAEMIPLEGFARTLNTIHGMILKINQMLLIDDAYTRDQTTVQGVINVLNDIIHKFEIIAPKQVMLVDDYGRMHSTPLYWDEWVDVDINSNPVEPTITFNHKYPYKEELPALKITNQNNNNSSGKFTLETVLLDNTGHVKTTPREEIELPHNFKTIKLNDSNQIIANSHVATLNISDDDWLSWTLHNDSQTLSLSHTNALTTNNTTVGLASAQTLNFGNTVQIPKISYDARGHISSTTTVGVTLPTLKTTADNGSSDGQVLSGTTGTLLNKRNLTSVVLTGYNGNTSLFSSTSTLNTALSAMMTKIVNLETRITALESQK